jgi:hypothetical protein
MGEMGSRASREEAPVQKVSKSVPLLKSKAKPIKVTSLLKATDELDGISYRPKTKDSKQAFDFLVSLVHSLMGADQPQSVTLTAADEILQILKREDVKDLDRKAAIDQLIGAIDTDNFMQLVNLGKRITDYSTSSAQSSEAIEGEDEETGVAVVFQEEDEDDGAEYTAAIADESEHDEDEVNDQDGFTLVQASAEEPMEDIFVVGPEPEKEYQCSSIASSLTVCRKEMQIDSGPVEDVAVVNLEELAFAEGNNSLFTHRSHYCRWSHHVK